MAFMKQIVMLLLALFVLLGTMTAVVEGAGGTAKSNQAGATSSAEVDDILRKRVRRVQQRLVKRATASATTATVTRKLRRTNSEKKKDKNKKSKKSKAQKWANKPPPTRAPTAAQSRQERAVGRSVRPRQNSVVCGTIRGS